MSQTVLTLIGELQPDRAEAARKLIEDLRVTVERAGRQQNAHHPYEPLVTAMPGLHFASIMVFDDERFDPMLTVELNFDGPAEAFLPRLQTPALLPHLREILKCCKKPEGDMRLYDQATQDGDMTPYLKTLIVRPAVAHQGNRGLDRERILRECDLYESVQAALDTPSCRDASDAVALHAALRSALAVKYAWLNGTPPERIPATERIVDWARLAVLVAAVLAVLIAPGFLLSLIAPTAGWVLFIAVLVAGLAKGTDLYLKREPGLPGPMRASQLPRQPPFWDDPIQATGAKLAIGAVLVVAIAFLVPALRPALLAGLAGAIAILAGVGFWLRQLETTDLVLEKPKIDPKRLREIMELEDQISQNHMGSVVHVKPGALRAVLVRLGLHGLGLLLRVAARNGFLADMRTIHFAHWALLDNGSRLLFFSNFDSSWESYLDDFIEKANPGLTLAWSNGIGFPRTRYLVLDGATHGPLFKAWARHSMAKGLFWVSAYPKLSVNQIERNCAIAEGLCARRLSPQAAASWAALL